MTCRILVVEDEIFVAAELEILIEEMGHQTVGIAPDKSSAMRLGSEADIALVDLNLHDGPTGAEIGRCLAAVHGTTVLFMTANPSQLGASIPGTLGVLPKPVSEAELKQAVEYAVARRRAQTATPPKRLRLFEYSNGFQVSQTA